MEKRPALGKGLSALIPDAPEPRVGPLEVDVDRLSPNAFQPRGLVDDERLANLARSIKSNGVIQPIVVRKVGDRFQIIAGERRWRAAQQAGLARVPVIVRAVAAGEERSLLEMALIENIQRENLNAIDEAQAYRRLADEFQLTQEDIAAAVGKDRATVANHPAPAEAARRSARRRIVGRPVDGPRARARLGLATEADQRRAARDVIARSLSVRETEALVKNLAEAGPAPGRKAGGQTGRRPHARRGRPAAPRPRHPRPHRPQRLARQDRGRFRVRGRADQDLRTAHRAAIIARPLTAGLAADARNMI